LDQQIKKLRLALIAASPSSLSFLSGQASYLAESGFEVNVISTAGDSLRSFCIREGCLWHEVDMSRAIHPRKDIVSILNLGKVFRRIRPHIVEAHMSKAGLLGMTAAWLAGVPVRIYRNHGASFSSAHGWYKNLLLAAESVTCHLASEVSCVSRSVGNLLVEARCCPAEKMNVLVNGSCGVDAAGRFNPRIARARNLQNVRESCNIPADAPVVGFVGRIVKHKGIAELLSAWQFLRDRFPSAHLLLVGGKDERNPISPETEKMLLSDDRVHLIGLVPDTAPYYTAMDVLALPSYHEGLPISILEASAMCLPIVASNIPGNSDAVVDGVTGTLVPVHDPVALAEAIAKYLSDPQLRISHGLAGRERVLRDFKPEDIWEATYQQYVRLLAQRGIVVPACEVTKEISRASEPPCEKAA
jgi:glycosyltransferase involved in cell wall biosynthesis